MAPSQDHVDSSRQQWPLPSTDSWHDVNEEPSFSTGTSTPNTLCNSTGDLEKSLQSLETTPAKAYHVFTKRQKWLVVITIGAAGLFSGLSSNIYFPALDTIAQDLKVSLSDVSLTITSYLIIQGISPLFWGSLSDTLGRRPIYIYSFTIYIIANIVLSFSPNFPVLLVFRGVQAVGSASTVSIGNGVIQDIALPVDRGAFISFYQAIRNFSIAIGPVLGGLLDNFFGFRSIFVFLLIASSLVLLSIVIFLPETVRTIAGDGTRPLSGIYQPLLRRFLDEPAFVKTAQDEKPQAVPKVTFATFLEPLKFLVQKDVLVSLVFGGIVYAIWSIVVATTTPIFQERFGLNELLLGVVFLPNGLGTIVGSAIAGKLMTRSFMKYEKAFRDTHPGSQPAKSKHVPIDFPIEHARLRHAPWITALFAVATGVYGVTVLPADQLPTDAGSRPGWIAVPLMLQFIIAATSNAIFAINTTLVADLCPGKGASATAINNLVRCSLGAVGVAVVDIPLSRFGPGATFLALGLFTVFGGALLAVEWSWGMRWRGQRERAQQAP